MDNYLLLINIINMFLLGNSIFTFHKLKKNRLEFKRFLGFAECLKDGSKELINQDIGMSLALQFREWINSEEGKKCIDSMLFAESKQSEPIEDYLLDAFLQGAIATYKAHQITVVGSIDRIKNE